MTSDYLALAGILAGALFLFWTQWLRTDLTALLVTITLIVPWPHPDGAWRGILRYQDAFSGFGSPAVIMVTAMFIFGAAMVRAGTAELIGRRLFKTCAHSEPLLQLAILGISTVSSMFINDTTVVVIFLPVILAVCKEHKLEPSHFLLWAAYGSLLGGQWTLIGTRSNLVVSEFLHGETGRGFGFFDLTPVAAVVFLVCALFLILFGRAWLPKKSGPTEPDERMSREYLSEVTVTPASKIVGKRLDEITWTRRTDLSLVEIIRGNERLPASGWLTVRSEDVFVVQGPVSTIGQLVQSADFALKDALQLNTRTLRNVDLAAVEALIGPRSDYAGRTLEQVDFRQDYGFTALGISRHGEPLNQRPLTTPLEFGDSLLLLGHIAGVPRLQRNENLLLLGQQPIHAINPTKMLITLSLLLFIVVSAISGFINPAISIPMASILVILLKCIDLESAYNSIDWQAVFTTAGMIPFGLAVEKTGAVRELSHLAITALQDFGPMTVLGMVLVLAIVLTHFIDNSATAVIVAPLAYEMARELNIDPYPFLIGVAVCISASFSTPFAHESTILVMGPGGYRFKHYLRIGGIMAILTWLVTLWLTPIVWPFR